MILVNLNWTPVILEGEDGSVMELAPSVKKDDEQDGDDCWYVVAKELVGLVEQFCGELPILCPGDSDWTPGDDGPIRCSFLFPGNSASLRKGKPA